MTVDEPFGSSAQFEKWVFAKEEGGGRIKPKRRVGAEVIRVARGFKVKLQAVAPRPLVPQ
jgi:hypothetical protein